MSIAEQLINSLIEADKPPRELNSVAVTAVKVAVGANKRKWSFKDTLTAKGKYVFVFGIYPEEWPYKGRGYSREAQDAYYETIVQKVEAKVRKALPSGWDVRATKGPGFYYRDLPAYGLEITTDAK